MFGLVGVSMVLLLRDVITGTPTIIIGLIAAHLIDTSIAVICHRQNTVNTRLS